MPEVSDIGYSPRAGRYFYTDTKKFVPRAVIENLLEQEQSRLEVRLKSLTRLLADQKIALPDWQAQFAETLKSAHLRMASLAAGGTAGLTSKHYGTIGANLRQQYKYLNGFAQQLASGKISIARALQRSGSYASSIRPSFHAAEKITRSEESFNMGKRLLDSQADHCSDCLGYATDGYVPIDAIVPPGTNCECGQRCRCRVVYQRLNKPGVLAG